MISLEISSIESSIERSHFRQLFGARKTKILICYGYKLHSIFFDFLMRLIRTRVCGHFCIPQEIFLKPIQKPAWKAPTWLLWA